MYHNILVIMGKSSVLNGALESILLFNSATLLGSKNSIGIAFIIKYIFLTTKTRNLCPSKPTLGFWGIEIQGLLSLELRADFSASRLRCRDFEIELGSWPTFLIYVERTW